MMTILSILFFIALIAITIYQKKKKSTKETSYQYYKLKSFLRYSELEFYRTLQSAAGDAYIIFAKPRVEDILKVKKGLNRSQGTTLRNYIKSRHTDFLLCDPQTSEPLIAIELDGSSHNSPRRKVRDARMNEIYVSAGMRYIHVPIARSRDIEYIRNFINPSFDTQNKNGVA